MDLKSEEAKRDTFREVLFELSKSQIALKEKVYRSSMYQRLEELYHCPDEEHEYRHFYSDIFFVLSLVKQGDKEGSIEILGQNLLEIRKGYQAKNKDSKGKLIDISDSLKKLHDHVSLDIARFLYSDASDRRLEQTENISNLRKDVNSMQEKVDDIAKVAKVASAARKKIQDLQKEYVAILGIFASIVLSFTAGIAFTSSVFENIHKASIYRTMMISLIVGIVFANSIWGLFYFINKIVHNPEKQSLKPLWITNGILIGLIVCVSIAWLLGAVEWRNNWVDNRSAYEPIAQTTCFENNIVSDMQTSAIITTE